MIGRNWQIWREKIILLLGISKMYFIRLKNFYIFEM